MKALPGHKTSTNTQHASSYDYRNDNQSQYSTVQYSTVQSCCIMIDERVFIITRILVLYVGISESNDAVFGRECISGQVAYAKDDIKK